MTEETTLSEVKQENEQTHLQSPHILFLGCCSWEVLVASEEAAEGGASAGGGGVDLEWAGSLSSHLSWRAMVAALEAAEGGGE